MENKTKRYLREGVVYNKWLEKKKKISFDITEEMLEMLDKWAKITHNSRTSMINALIGAGVFPLMQTFEKTGKEHLSKKGLNAKVKNSMKEMLSNLEKFKKEYKIE